MCGALFDLPPPPPRGGEGGEVYSPPPPLVLPHVPDRPTSLRPPVAFGNMGKPPTDKFCLEMAECRPERPPRTAVTRGARAAPPAVYGRTHGHMCSPDACHIPLPRAMAPTDKQRTPAGGAGAQLGSPASAGPAPSRPGCHWRMALPPGCQRTPCGRGCQGRGVKSAALNSTVKKMRKPLKKSDAKKSKKKKKERKKEPGQWILGVLFTLSGGVVGAVHARCV